MDIENEGVRLNKYLSEIGHCSRRAADKLIDAGRIQVNGQQVVMGQKVTPQDRIEIDGILVEDLREKNVYLAFINPLESSALQTHELKKTTSSSTSIILRGFFQ